MRRLYIAYDNVGAAVEDFIRVVSFLDTQHPSLTWSAKVAKFPPSYPSNDSIVFYFDQEESNSIAGALKYYDSFLNAVEQKSPFLQRISSSMGMSDEPLAMLNERPLSFGEHRSRLIGDILRATIINHMDIVDASKKICEAMQVNFYNIAENSYE